MDKNLRFGLCVFWNTLFIDEQLFILLHIEGGKLSLRSEKKMCWFQTSCCDWAASFFSVSLAMTSFTISNALASSLWRRTSLSEKVTWEARVLQTALISLLQNQMYDSFLVSVSSS